MIPADATGLDVAFDFHDSFLFFFELFEALTAPSLIPTRLRVKTLTKIQISFFGQDSPGFTRIHRGSDCRQGLRPTR